MFFNLFQHKLQQERVFFMIFKSMFFLLVCPKWKQYCLKCIKWWFWRDDTNEDCRSFFLPLRRIVSCTWCRWCSRWHASTDRKRFLSQWLISWIQFWYMWCSRWHASTKSFFLLSKFIFLNLRIPTWQSTLQFTLTDWPAQNRG